jgi:hypothetical protein
MLDFAVRLTEAPDKIEEADRESLRCAGFTDRDIWDIASVTAFYNMSNRLAAAADIRPNREYHYLVREPGDGAAGAQAGSQHAAGSLPAGASVPARGRRARAR